MLARPENWSRATRQRQASLTIAALRRERAADDHDRRPGRERPRRPDGSLRRPATTTSREHLAERLAGHRQRVEVEQSRELLHHAPGRRPRPRSPRSARRRSAGRRRAAACARRSSRTARRRPRRHAASIAIACRCLTQLIEPLRRSTVSDRVGERRRRENVARLAGPPTPSARSARPTAARSPTSAGCSPATGALPGQGHPERLARRCASSSRCPCPAHTPGPRTATSLIPGSSSTVIRAARDRPGVRGTPPRCPCAGRGTRRSAGSRRPP